MSDLERAGYADDPEVLGGGMFGIVDKSNWTVCDQEPAAGETVSDTPRLTVDRTCEDSDDLDGEARALVEPSPSPSPTPTEVEPEPEPTPQEVWVTNYRGDEQSYIKALAVALALKPRNVDAPAGALNVCQLLGKERNLDKRVARAGKAFSPTSEPTYDQALAAINETTATICPEFAAFHQTQTDQRAKRLRAEEKRRKEEERRRKEEQDAQAPAPPPSNVFYANCSEVEAAGAAPIYAGEPGYSTSLDRDGDGVACEQ